MNINILVTGLSQHPRAGAGHALHQLEMPFRLQNADASGLRYDWQRRRIESRFHLGSAFSALLGRHQPRTGFSMQGDAPGICQRSAVGA